MSRSALTFASAVACSFLLNSTVFTQSKPAPAAPAKPAPAQAAPAAKTKWVPPVRGVATIGMLRPDTKVVKDEVITKIRLKNLSTGSIALLRIDEYWYDKQGNMLPGDTQRVRKPILPGEIIEVELKVPRNPKFFQNQYKFSHANGTIEVKAMKTLS
ncbi:MAG TPA: hypothetical protein VK886_19965 [Vicinamibacterales bacterium]|nr:hypothetical protein [Vicinamibacterales bacterium]